MDTCANCGGGIGKLESPFAWKGHTVCVACYAKLKQGAAMNDVVIPYATPTPSGRRVIALGIATAVLLIIAGALFMLLRLSSRQATVINPAPTPPQQAPYATTAPADSGPPDPAR
jgi:hypothetical protein